jgi:hypothetical protein
MLFGAGLISADQLGELVRDTIQLGRPASELAVERGFVSAEALHTVLAQNGTATPAAPPVEIQATEPAPPTIALDFAPVEIEPAQPQPTFELSSAQALLLAEETVIPAEPLAAAEPFAPLTFEAAPVESAPAQPMPTFDLAAMPAPAIAEEAAVPAEPVTAAAEPLAAVMPLRPPAEAEVAAEPAFAVLVRLQTGERVAVDTATSYEAAVGVARTIAAGFAGTTEWPLLAGRCIRPEAVVSVDIERNLQT